MKNTCFDCIDKSCAVGKLEPEALLLLSQNCSEVFFKKGQIIFKQQTLTTHVTYLKRGLIKEYFVMPDGRESIVQIIKSRSYLGLSSMMGSRTFHYSYAALEDATLCFIDTTVFKKLIQNNGNFGYEILLSVCEESINNYHRCIVKTGKQTYGRVADALLYFANIIYCSNEFTLPLTYSELASITSNTRESVNRTLLSFKNEGIIEINDRRIKILKKDVLERISSKG